MLDEALIELSGRKKSWVQVGVGDRLALLDHVMRDFRSVEEAWVAQSAALHGEATTRRLGDEWVVGPLVITRVIIALRRRLRDVARGGAPAGPGPVRTRHGPDGDQTVLRVVPDSNIDRLAFPGTSIDVRLRSGAGVADPEPNRASDHGRDGEGAVALVLGAGNVSSIPVTDVLEKLFVQDEVVLLKLNPVNDHLAGVIEAALAALLRDGFVRVVTGGADVGAYLCEHPLVDTVHMTGSSPSFDAIVFGPGEDGAARKARREPKLSKPMTAELGDINPVIVVPGPWTRKDLDYQAHHVASALTAVAAFTCATPRLLIQHVGWPLRAALLDEIGRYLSRIPTRIAYYPGAHVRWRALTAEHPEARRYGAPRDGALPWTIVPDLDPEHDDLCFELEPFCSLASEVALPGTDAADFLDRAVEFVNERLWGSLSVAVLVHPRSLQELRVAAAVARAVDRLRYGTVAINNMTNISWSFGSAPWGAYPGNERWNVGSGIGFMHNPWRLAGIEKSVLRSPFRSLPTPPQFAGHERYGEVARHLTHLYADPRALRLAHVVGSLLRGWM